MSWPDLRALNEEFLRQVALTAGADPHFATEVAKEIHEMHLNDRASVGSVQVQCDEVRWACSAALPPRNPQVP